MVLSFKSRVQVVVGMVLILAAPVFCGCVTQSNPEIDRALEYAGDNRKELEYVLDHYADSLEKLEAAKFLIANLPYHIGDERLTPWRKIYEDRYATRLDSLYDGDDVLKACQVVMDQISKEGLGWYNDELSTPHRDALSLLGNRVGNCRDDCDRYIYALRACRILPYI